RSRFAARSSPAGSGAPCSGTPGLVQTLKRRPRTATSAVSHASESPTETPRRPGCDRRSRFAIAEVEYNPPPSHATPRPSAGFLRLILLDARRSPRRRAGNPMDGPSSVMRCFLEPRSEITMHKAEDVSRSQRATHGTAAEPSATTIPRRRNSLVDVLKLLGPGLITGASDDDPSGIGTYAVVGASVGSGALWTALVTFPMMAAIQFICAKIGLVSGLGLAGVLKRHYPRWTLYPAVLGLAIANTINAGADVGAIAAGINLLVPIPPTLLVVPIAVVIVATLIWGSYDFINRVFKWLTL